MSGRVGPRSVLLIALLTVALIPAAEGAAGDAGGRATLGGDLRLSGPDATGDDWRPALAYSETSGVFLVVREDERAPFARGSDIFGRRVGAAGKAFGADIRISGKGATENDRSPAVAWNKTGNEFLVVWADYRQEADYGAEIWGQRVKADGSLLGANFRISSGISDQTSPAVAWNGADNQYLVVWEDNRNAGFHGADIYGRRVAADGTMVDAKDFLISYHEAGSDQQSYEKFPDVAWNSVREDYLVVWQDIETGSNRGWEIYGRVVTGDGALDGDEFRICGPNATSHEQWPAVAYSRAHNNYLVVWMDFRKPDRGADIFSRRVHSTGYVTGKEVRLSGAAATADEAVPAVAWGASSGYYLVVWDDTRDSVADSSDTWGQWVTGLGETVGGNFRISGNAAAGTEWTPAVAWGKSISKFLVVRADARDAATPKKVDIFGRLVSP